MLNGTTCRAEEIAGTAVLRIVVSSDSIKNATATSHGNSRLLASEGAKEASFAESPGSSGGNVDFEDVGFKEAARAVNFGEQFVG